MDEVTQFCQKVNQYSFTRSIFLYVVDSIVPHVSAKAGITRLIDPERERERQIVDLSPITPEKSLDPSTMLINILLNTMLLKSVISGAPNSLLWSSARSECAVSELTLARQMSQAQLDAHRCLLRDVAVELQPPNHLIYAKIQPSHVVLQRCNGLCLSKSGCMCSPRKIRRIRIKAIIETYSSSTNNVTNNTTTSAKKNAVICTTVTVSEHRGPCRCRCFTRPHHCHRNQIYDASNCRCVCSEQWSALKAACFSSVWHEWHEQSCSCVCRPRRCPSGQFQDINTCKCRETKQNCVQIRKSENFHNFWIYSFLFVAILSSFLASIICLVLLLQRCFKTSRHREQRNVICINRDETKFEICSGQELLDARNDALCQQD